VARRFQVVKSDVGVVLIFEVNMQKVNLIDAEMWQGNKTSHPNLAIMKMSSYYKAQGYDVKLLTDSQDIRTGDIIKISKVFNWTEDPILPPLCYQECKVEVGGTGYFYDNAPSLPYEIEHSKPDYHLYDEYIKERLITHPHKAHPENYEKFSIGFLTRGCFRKCSFCVNKKYDKAVVHSPIEEFLDETRPYIRFWDDNFLSINHKDFLRIIDDIINVDKPVVWQQGLDIRLMTEEKADIISSLRWYKNNWLFALDCVEDIPKVSIGFQNWIKYVKRNTHIRSMFGKVYVLVGFKGLDIEDIESMFKRIKFLSENSLISMPMFYNGTTHINQSEYHWLYKLVKNWTNPICFGKQSLMQYATKYRSKLLPHIDELLLQFPHLTQYFYMKYCDLRKV